LVKTLATYWKDDFNRYVEPFVGSACLFFFLRPPTALLSDINGELISTYRQVKYRPADVATHLKTFKKNRETYYSIRSMDARALETARRAARFIYLNRCCFNGLYRTNLRGEFNVPYGGRGSGAIPSQEVLQLCSRALKAASLVHGDFETILDQVKYGDFVYMDPPFSVNARRVFKEYSATLFGLDDVQRLRKRLERLADENVHFLVSYLDSSEARILARGFRVQRVNVRRNISGFVKTRSMSQEMLISYP
jgi:DNA adenine methylase